MPLSNSQFLAYEIIGPIRDICSTTGIEYSLCVCV